MQAQAAGHANTEDEERQDEDAVRCSAIVDQPRAAVGMLEEFSSVGLGQDGRAGEDDRAEPRLLVRVNSLERFRD